MRVGLFDLESNGFLHQATKIHCGTVKVLRGEKRKFRPHEINEMLEYMSTFDVLIAHNGIGYDFPLLRKLKKWGFKGKIVDTKKEGKELMFFVKLTGGQQVKVVRSDFELDETNNYHSLFHIKCNTCEI